MTAPSTGTAQELGKLARLPDTLPSSVEARVGKIDFRRGLPTPKGIEQLFEIQDAMITKTPGVGSIYLETYRDKDGDWLDGGKSYRLLIAPDPPMQQFWAVSVYDIDTRTYVRNETQKAEVSSKSTELQKNADGSVDLYFGPKAPTGKESNWVQTVA